MTPYPHFHGEHSPPVVQRLRSFFPETEYRGVIVDVGAGLPVTISNSYHFEQNGWRAVCIEPNAYLAEELRQHRREVVACAVADYCADDVPFTIVHSGYGMTSASGLAVYDAFLADPNLRLQRTEELCVQDRTLDWLAANLEPPLTSIDILSIDTEGYEFPVLRGLTTIKPQVIVVVSRNYDREVSRKTGRIA